AGLAHLPPADGPGLHGVEAIDRNGRHWLADIDHAREPALPLVYLIQFTDITPLRLAESARSAMLERFGRELRAAVEPLLEALGQAHQRDGRPEWANAVEAHARRILAIADAAAGERLREPRAGRVAALPKSGRNRPSPLDGGPLAAIQSLQIQSLMQIVTLGLNHTTAPVALREKVAFTAEIVGDALRDLSRSVRSLAPESAILSTCNRTEIYCATQAPDELQPALSEWLATRQGVPGESIENHLYKRPGDAAVRHAFRVASGLDSMVLGEPQILGQMKEAARVAQQAGA